MTSPIRQNLFERECDMPLLEARHIALLLSGLMLPNQQMPCRQNTAGELSYPARRHQPHHQSNGHGQRPANKRMFYADEMFALAWRLIDDELTPPEIKARSLKAVTKLSRNSRGRKWLKTLGDDALPESHGFSTTFPAWDA